MTYVPLLDTSIDLRKTVPRVLIDFSKTDDVAQDMIRELSVLKRKIKGSSGSVLFRNKPVLQTMIILKSYMALDASSYGPVIMGIPEPPIPGLFGSPLVSESRGVFVRQILVDIGALALTDTGKIITASLICWLYVLCVFVNYAKYAVLKISHGIRWGELSLK
nr:uncharacterized protein LOC117281554 [Nicotiana tomentosiformis]